MAELDANNVRVAITGELSVGPEGTEAPTTAGAVIPDMKGLGYINEDGVSESRERSSTKLKAWQNAATVRTIVEEAALQLKTALIETNVETVGLYYGTTVDPATGAILIDPSQTGGRKAFCLDVIDGDDFIRTWIPSGEIVEVGEQVYKNGEPIGYEVTIEAYMTEIDGKPASAKKFYSSLKDQSSDSHPSGADPDGTEPGA